MQLGQSLSLYQYFKWLTFFTGKEKMAITVLTQLVGRN